MIGYQFYPLPNIKINFFILVLQLLPAANNPKRFTYKISLLISYLLIIALVSSHNNLQEIKMIIILSDLTGRSNVLICNCITVAMAAS
jgi:hypothetical protein